ncbi:uncharacterized protein LOC135465797 [Liolophura sinensis]|uniref:uncharacterized protein LOC135465797 n=1 Tax=Liolophura sinensis TaxID=3198878 RepID=UPI00315981A4
MTVKMISRVFVKVSEGVSARVTVKMTARVFVRVSCGVSARVTVKMIARVFVKVSQEGTFSTDLSGYVIHPSRRHGTDTVLHHEVHRVDDTSHFHQPNTLPGSSYLGTVCTDFGVSVCEDFFDFITIVIAARELGRGLGANYDGVDILCDPEDKFIMAPVSAPSNDVNPWHFSNCSLDDFRDKMAALGIESCLLSDDTVVDASEFEPLLSISPGQVYTLDEQCQLSLGETSYFCRAFYQPDQYGEACAGALCSIPGSQSCTAILPGQETPCGDKEWCIDGLCVSDDNATSVSDTCPHGDQPRGIIGSFTCADIANLTLLCYGDLYRLACCEACESVFTGLPGCEYGDVAQTCQSITRAGCYLQELVCCETCPPLKNTTQPGCEFGDRIEDCVEEECPNYNSTTLYMDCCETCAEFRIITSTSKITDATTTDATTTEAITTDAPTTDAPTTDATTTETTTIETTTNEATTTDATTTNATTTDATTTDATTTDTTTTDTTTTDATTTDATTTDATTTDAITLDPTTMEATTTDATSTDATTADAITTDSTTMDATTTSVTTTDATTMDATSTDGTTTDAITTDSSTMDATTTGATTTEATTTDLSTTTDATTTATTTDGTITTTPTGSTGTTTVEVTCSETGSAPWIIEVLSGGTCDTSSSSCVELVVEVLERTPVHNTSDLLCRFRQFVVDEMGPLFTGPTTLVPGHYITCNLIACLIPNDTIPMLDGRAVAGWYVSVSDDGIMFGNEAIYLPYDSRCVTCTGVNTLPMCTWMVCIVKGASRNGRILLGGLLIILVLITHVFW